MWVGWCHVVGRLVDLTALHSERPIAVVELIDKIFGRVGNTDSADDFVPLNDHAARSIAFTPRRRHVEDSLRDDQLVTA